MKEVFSPKLQEHIPYVFSLCYKLTTDAEISQDIAQETLLTAWEKQSQLKDLDKLKPWLRKIALNIFLNQKRKEKIKILSAEELLETEKDGHKFELISPAPSIEQEIIANESIRAIRNGCFLAMAKKLTLEQRIVFSLSEMFEISPEEISEIMQISIPAVKGLLFRARKNIFSFFSERCQWIDYSAPCKCSAWIDFAGIKEKNRRELRDRNIIQSFPDNPEERSIKSEHREKIISMYRNIPDSYPPDDWYEKITAVIKNF
ncbi:MAG: RNA polymerase sigma factor [Spirochaetes bacterium]|nr:RNA polymerase sigma factor [Spirochaetota bacterium]